MLAGNCKCLLMRCDLESNYEIPLLTTLWLVGAMNNMSYTLLDAK